ncbi:MAG: phytoene desaturase family protein [Alphaproteobacteria bacterium]
MTERFDVAIVGAGHNGLVAANYLARAGLSVLVLEAREVVGGACVTEALFPDHPETRWSSCAFVQGLFRDEIVRELELARFGLSMYAPDVQGFSLFEDGSHLFLWAELDRTLREIERYSRKDAEAFLLFGSRFRRFGEILFPFMAMPPVPRSEVFKAFEAAGEEALLDEFLLGSARDLLDRYFESPHVKGFLCFFGMVSIWGSPSTPGTSYVYGHHASGSFEGHLSRWAFVRGGMGGITRALADAARAHGATIRTDAPVGRVIVRGGRARGVALQSGEEIDAGIVVSNADPKRSLLGLVEPGVLDTGFRDAVAAIDQRGSMARVHLLVDALPDYRGLPPGAGPQHRGHQMLGASLEAFERAFEAQRAGVIPDNMQIEAIIQSVTDPSLAPEGLHTLTLGVQHVPAELASGTWDDAKEAWADKVVDTLCRYAPNMRDHIVARRVITPLDLERDYNLTGGNIFHAAMTLPQLFGARPLPALASYRTPVGGYYLCGAGMHPGGGVMGLPGRNAATVILADLKGETARRTAAAPAHRGLVDRALETALGRKLGRALARNAALRPLTERAARSRK